MSKKKHIIPNPNKISEQEMLFLKNDHVIERKENVEKKQDQYKGRMISMSDSFYDELNNYLKQNPTEGNRSSFVVRIVANYIKTKTSIN